MLFLKDEGGFIVSAELVILITILVIGLITGFSQVRDALVSELQDVARAIGVLNQSYYTSGFHVRGPYYLKSATSGSAFIDWADHCDVCGGVQYAIPSPEVRRVTVSRYGPPPGH